MADRVGGAQQRRDRLAHGVVDDQALAAEVDERQRAQPRERVDRVVDQRAEQRERHTAQDAGGVERLPCRVVEPVEVERGELLGDGRELGRGRREQQRERVAAREAVRFLRLRVVEPLAVEQLGGVGGGERAERNRAHQLTERRAPHGSGRVAGRDHDPRGRRQRRQVRRAQPAVEQPQPFEGVDDQDARRVTGGAEEALRRRLDRAAVDPGDVLALAREGPQQRGLARARDAVDHRDRRRVPQRLELGVAADQAPLGEQRAERPHAANAAITGLMLPTGSIAASEYRSIHSGLVAS